MPVVGRPFICAHWCHTWLWLPCLSRSSRTRRAGKARIVPSIGRKRKPRWCCSTSEGWEKLPTALISVRSATPMEATAPGARSPRSGPQKRAARQPGRGSWAPALLSQAAWRHHQEATRYTARTLHDECGPWHITS